MKALNMNQRSTMQPTEQTLTPPVTRIAQNRWLPSRNTARYVKKVIEEGGIATYGPFAKRCEQTLLGMFSPFADSVQLTTSCTSALEVAAMACGLKQGDEVIVPAFTFPSTINAMLIGGATPRFADVDLATGSLTPDTIEPLITPATRAVVVVHYAGIAHSPDVLADFCRSRGLMLIEDNAHGLGGMYAGQPLGSFGHLSTLSFHYTKNIGCGEGGALIISRHENFPGIEHIRENGTNRSAFFRHDVRFYDWQRLGTNAMMSEPSAAILASKFEEFLWIQNKRKGIWNDYHAGLARWSDATGIALPHVPDACDHSAHIYYVRLRNPQQKNRFLAYMEAADIQVLTHFRPLNRSPAADLLSPAPEACPQAELLADTLVRLPLHPYLSKTDVERVIDHVASFEMAP